MNTPVVRLDQVTFTHTGAPAPVWVHVSCAFPEGGIHVIAGPSGCGKSTLLQAINGLIPHINEGELTGRVLFRGKDVTDVDARHRCAHIGYVMQDPEGQFCTFTVEEELAFGMENLGIDPAEIAYRSERVLAVMGMEDLMDRSLSALSGGQKQKIAIASVLAMEPDVLLLDEPTANLDPVSRNDVLQLVVSSARRSGMTVIMVEHNLSDIIDAIDTFTVMDAQGNVVVQGSRSDVVGRLEDPDCSEFRGYLPGSLWGPQAIESVWQDDDLTVRGEPVLRVSDVSFAYPLNKGFRKRTYGPPVLDGVDLTVYQEDFLAVVGQNGTGKSTLFNVIFGLYEQQSGSVELFGQDTRTMRKKDMYRTMGLVFQNPELQFITNQVDDELMASLKDEPMSDGEKHDRVNAMLERYGLLPYAGQSPFVLSQGQKRRLSVATMLLTSQKMLFLDEPTYGQDAQNRIELMDEMLRLNSQGVAIVMITHDLELIRRYAKRVVCLDSGKVVLDGTPADYDRMLCDAETDRASDRRMEGGQVDHV
ncbi:ABC transporter ATP-binding protein [Slackia heliotrinireducens]|uniref:ABC transporter ATP-binding protein n=1 Tax=Slackia heliotrinireducens TaxID=84110 RepID=UPI003315AF66